MQPVILNLFSRGLSGTILYYWQPAFFIERFWSITHKRCMKSALAAEPVPYSALFSLSLSRVWKLVLNALLCLCSDDLVFSLSVPGSPIVALPPCLPLIQSVPLTMFTDSAPRYCMNVQSGLESFCAIFQPAFPVPRSLLIRPLVLV